jgi:hypothetical protein
MYSTPDVTGGGTKGNNIMKIRNFVIAGVMTAASIVAIIPATSSFAAECSVGAVGGDHTQKNITVNGTTASVKFAVKGDANCKQDVTFAAWEAPSKTGLPLSEQKLYNFKTGNYGVGIHEVSVQLPVCETDKNIVRFYQADLLRGTNPTNVNGSADYAATGESARLIDWKIGGEECPDPVTPVTPEKPATPAATPTVLPNTGAASLIAPVLLTSSLAGVAHNIRARRNRQ